MANTFAVGSIEVLAVSDGAVTLKPTDYFPASTEDDWKQHSRWLDHDGQLSFPFGCFIIRTGDKTVLVDTGLGPLKFGAYEGGQLLPELKAAGIEPDSVDVVFVTHLHADHCGSAAIKTDREMKPAFPNAVYRWTAAEDAFWNGDDLPPGSFARKDIFAAVKPRFEAADGGATIAPGVDVISLPGHTPGSAGVVISSGVARAYLLGDAIGCPVQLEEPEWSGLGDVDPGLARRTQEAVAREMEGNGALAGASHFPGLTFGRVLSGAGRRYWQPI